METHKFNEIQQKKSERKHLINFFRQLTFRYRVKFLAVFAASELVQCLLKFNLNFLVYQYKPPSGYET